MNTQKIVVFLTCIAVFALMLAMSAFLVKPSKAAEQVTIVNHQGYLDVSGYYVVYGEVKNTGDTAAKNIYVKMTYYDASNAVLDEDERSIELNVLMPGRKSPFMGNAGVQGSLVKSYKVELEDLTMSTDSLPSGLEITSSKSEVNIINNMMINGTVKNTGTEVATYVRVYVTIYDGPSGTGNVVAVTSGTAQPYNLDPGQTGDFETGFFVTPGKSYVSYVLATESDQYTVTTEYIAAIPEFSSFFVIPLLIATILIVAVAVKRKQLQTAHSNLN